MFRMWGKLTKNSKVMKDIIITDHDYTKSRTQMVLQALDEICHAFDLETPIWLDMNVQEFRRRSRTRFGQDSFIEHIGFDYLEIQVLEEDS